jgi:peptidoglycan/xylan/chitin deacetylase (PgdA/CDA1 family)
VLKKLAKRAIRYALTDLGAIRVLRPGYRGLGTIFMLHRAGAKDERYIDPDLVTPVDFLDELLGQIRPWGWDIVSLDEVRRRLTEGRSDRPFVCFTFDDGYRDNLTVALPVFRRHDAPMAVYISSGLVDREVKYWWGALEILIWSRDSIEITWPDGQVRGMPLNTRHDKWSAYELITKWVHTDPIGYSAKLEEALSRYGISLESGLEKDLLSWDEARRLARDPLVTIGGHTVGHHRLAHLSPEHAEDEMRADRMRLERELGVPVRHFAYPYGNSDSCGPREFQLAERIGFLTATTTRYGNIMPEHAHHLTALPRQLMGASTQTLAGAHDCLIGTTTLLSRRERLRTI